MLKLTPNAGPASVEARLTARGSLARRQNRFADVIDATPCAFIFMAVGASRNDSGGLIRSAWVSTRRAAHVKLLNEKAFFSGSYLLPTIASRCYCLIPLKCDLQLSALWHSPISTDTRSAEAGWLKIRIWQAKTLAWWRLAAHCHDQSQAMTLKKRQRVRGAAVSALPFDDVHADSLLVELADTGLGNFGNKGDLARNRPLVQVPLLHEWLEVFLQFALAPMTWPFTQYQQGKRPLAPLWIGNPDHCHFAHRHVTTASGLRGPATTPTRHRS
jgi:hypothetical protein